MAFINVRNLAAVSLALAVGAASHATHADARGGAAAQTDTGACGSQGQCLGSENLLLQLEHRQTAVSAAAAAAGHSWVVQVGTGQNMGRSRGGITGGDHHSQRYFCPYDDLEACKPNPKHGVVLLKGAMRPCRSDALSNPKGKVVAGDNLYVSWMGNGHVNNGQSDGTCVRLMLADFARDPAFEDFTELPGGGCVEYWHWGANGRPETSTFIEIPSSTKPGTHTLLWYWKFTEFWYSSCADIEVLPAGGDGSSSPVTTMTTTSDDTAWLSTTPEANTTAAMDSYMRYGCNAEQTSTSDLQEFADAFCTRYVAPGSYCKTWKPDECGRAVCHGGTDLLPCGAATPRPSSPPASTTTTGSTTAPGSINIITTTGDASTTSDPAPSPEPAPEPEPAPSKALCGDALCQSLRPGSWCRASNGVCHWINVPCKCA